MAEGAARSLATFNLLALQQQHELLVELLRRSGELPRTSLSDEHCIGLEDNLLQSLDAVNSHGAKSNAKRGLAGGAGYGGQDAALPGPVKEKR